MEAPPAGSHLSPIKAMEAPPLVAPADDASVIEIPPEVLAQQRVDALEAKLDALLNGGPRYQPVEKEELPQKKEAWGRAEGCAAVSALFDARAHEVCDLQQMQDVVGCPPIPESLTAFVQAQFQLTFRSKHITEEKLEAFCACVDEAIEALQHFKGEGERGQARAERLALFRDSLTSLPCFDSMSVILQSLAKDGKLESIAQALPPVGDVMVPVRGGTLIARLPKLATDDPRGPPRVMSLHAKTCSITTVVRALAERDLLPDEEVLRYVLDELDVVPVRSRRPVAFRRPYAIDATRIHQTRPWVVSFSILSAFRARSRLDAYHTQACSTTSSSACSPRTCSRPGTPSRRRGKKIG